MIINDVTMLSLLAVLHLFVLGSLVLIIMRLNVIEDSLFGETIRVYDSPDQHDDEQEEEEIEKYFIDSYERNLELDERTRMLKDEIARSHVGTRTTPAEPVAGLYDLDVSTIPYKEKVEHEYAD